MKTDAELNQLIAEHVTKPKQILVGKDHDPIGIAMVFEWEYPVIDYCTDPAAWGALFDLLCEQGRKPTIRKCHMTKNGMADLREASVLALGSEELDLDGYLKGFAVGYHRLTGRALALATLAAYGVEVE